MKPQDFFIGIRDVLALLVPGALLVLLLPRSILDLTARKVLGLTPDPALAFLIFLFVALAAGSVLAAVSSVADDPVDQFIEGKATWLTWVLFPKQFVRRAQLEECRELAKALEASACTPLIGSCEPPWSTKSFWWNYLRVHCPEATAALDRTEGVQKQNRSLALLGLIGFAASIAALAVQLMEDCWPAAIRVAANWMAPTVPLALGHAGSAIVLTVIFTNIYVKQRIQFSRRLFELAVVERVGSK